MPIPRPAEFALPHMSESDLIAAVRKQAEQDAAAGGQTLTRCHIVEPRQAAATPRWKISWPLPMRYSRISCSMRTTPSKIDTPRDSSRYAYGFSDRTINGTRCFGHSSGAPGMNGDLEICGSYVVAALANEDPQAASKISDFFTNRLPIQVGISH